MNRLLTAHQHY